MKTIIFIHGFKKNGENAFKDFITFFKENTINVSEFNIIEFDYYDNLDKNTLNQKKWKEKILSIFEQNKENEVYLIGYSMGAVASLTLSKDFPNVTKIFAIVPAMTINYFEWNLKILKNISKAKKLKKKLGPERYKRMKELRSKGATEKYPIKIVKNMNLFRKHLRKDLKNIINKDIEIMFSVNDEVNNLRKTISYINDKIRYKENEIKISFVKETHFEILNKKALENFKTIIDFINK